MAISKDITTEKLTVAVKISAKVVSLYGESYFPIFFRLQNELQELKDKNRQKNTALKTLKSYINH